MTRIVFALVASQAVIISSWSDAKFGTLANAMLLVAVLYGFASRGPWSLRAEFERDLERATASTPAQVLTEADLAPLPEPVRRYVRRLVGPTGISFPALSQASRSQVLIWS